MVCQHTADWPASTVGRPAPAGHRGREEFHFPEDETCFFVFQAPPKSDALYAARHADLLRAVEAVMSGEE